MEICKIDIEGEGLKLIGSGFMGLIYKLGEGNVLKVYDLGGRKSYMKKAVAEVAMREIRALVKAKQLLALGVTDGLADMGDFAKCWVTRGGDQFRIVLKYYPFNFRDILEKFPDSMLRKVWLNIMLQIKYNIEVIHKRMGLVHNDIDITNVMFEKIEEGEGEGYFEYDFGEENGGKFWVESIGYRVVIIDFGEAVQKERGNEEEDYKFFFEEGEWQSWNRNSNEFYKFSDIHELLYRNYTLDEMLQILGKDSDIVREVVQDVKMKCGKKCIKNEKKFLNKMKYNLSKAVTRYWSKEYWKKFDKVVEELLVVKRPKGIVREFNERFANKVGWKKDDMQGYLLGSYAL